MPKSTKNLRAADLAEKLSKNETNELKEETVPLSPGKSTTRTFTLGDAEFENSFFAKKIGVTTSTPYEDTADSLFAQQIESGIMQVFCHDLLHYLFNEPQPRSFLFQIDKNNFWLISDNVSSITSLQEKFDKEISRFEALLEFKKEIQGYLKGNNLKNLYDEENKDERQIFLNALYEHLHLLYPNEFKTIEIFQSIFNFEKINNYQLMNTILTKMLKQLETDIEKQKFRLVLSWMKPNLQNF